MASSPSTARRGSLSSAGVYLRPSAPPPLHPFTQYPCGWEVLTDVVCRAAANTRMGVKRMRSVRVRGGHIKNRALRLDHGTFSWGSESISKPSRVLDVVYNATNNELVRTKTLVKGAIIMIDATPFRQWYMQHYGLELGRKAADDAVKKSRKVVKKQEGRVKVESAMVRFPVLPLVPLPL